MKEIITTIKIDDDGNVIETSTETKVIEEKKEEVTHEYSEYARWFDSECYPVWDARPGMNLHLLQLVQLHCNYKLKVEGGLYLNDVYDMLGMPRTKLGEIVGWIYDERNPIGDNFVDFDIFNKRNSDFINGFTNKILLDFNVDGDITWKFRRVR